MWPQRKKRSNQSSGLRTADAAVTDTRTEDTLEQGSGTGTERASAESIEELTAKTITSVRHHAVRLLSSREYGRLELREKLLQRDLPEAAIDIALGQLAEIGLQCDIRFAESYTRMRVNRGFGPNKITADLLSRKLNREVIADAIADCDVNWTSNAYTALLKKFGDPGNNYGRVTADPDFGGSASDRARMQRFLHSRGYNQTQISAAINQLRQRVE